MTKIELMRWIKNCNDKDEIIVIADYDRVKITGIDTSEEGQIVIECETVEKPVIPCEHTCANCSNYSEHGVCNLGHICLDGSEWCPKVEREVKQMKTVDLDTWEQQNIECLTSRGMGEWLHRRDNRVISDLLHKLRNEITMLPVFNRELVIEAIDKHLKGVSDGNS